MAGSSDRRSDCPVACSLDIFGDKWSLLIIRDIFEGKKRFGELSASMEGIPTNILTNRLKRMVAEGILEKRLYCQKPPRAEYVLTEKGTDLRDVVMVLFKWGRKHVPGTRQKLPEQDISPRL